MKIYLSPKHWLLISLFVLFFLYVLFQARFLILGPQVWINYPKDGETVVSPVVVMKGVARNAAWLTLNGRQIFTDENGLWNEKLIVSPGLSIITARVIDRFGREKSKSIRIILND
ncbi:MAG: hypothetical protein AAB641_00390 [Patescibacteria group bacterium]